MGDEIFEKIKCLVGETQGIKPARIERATRLELDLNIYGDDASELLLAYCKLFNVDLSQFMFDSYFSPEAFDPMAPIMSLFYGRRRSVRERELTIGDLEKGVIAGKLNEEVITATKAFYA
jgi:hypothetical protein